MRIWDVATGQQRALLPGHPGGVTDLAFAPSGRQLATAGADKAVRLWNAMRSPIQPLATLPSDNVAFVLYAPDGKTLATADKDKAILLSNAIPKPVPSVLSGRIPRVNGAAYSSDGKCFAAACHDKTILIWDWPQGGAPRLTLRGHKLPVLCVAFSPDGKTLASTSGDPEDFDPERGLLGEVKLWDLESGKEKASYSGHGDIVFAAVFAPDGKTLATASRDGTAKLWDLAAGKERFTFDDHEAEVRSVAFSPDGKTLATAGADGTVRLWDAGTGKEVKQLEVKDSAITCVRFSPDGKTLAAGASAGGNPRFGVPVRGDHRHLGHRHGQISPGHARTQGTGPRPRLHAPTARRCSPRAASWASLARCCSGTWPAAVCWRGSTAIMDRSGVWPSLLTGAHLIERRGQSRQPGRNPFLAAARERWTPHTGRAHRPADLCRVQPRRQDAGDRCGGQDHQAVGHGDRERTRRLQGIRQSAALLAAVARWQDAGRGRSRRQDSDAPGPDRSRQSCRSYDGNN